jgi:membrane-associated phospholipid phosphatase
MVEAAYDSGVGFILYLQSLGDWLIPPMQFFSFIGREEFFLLLMPLLYWSTNHILGLRVAMILTLSSGLSEVLKMAFHSPRPFWYSPQVHAFIIETTFGLPSGHAQNAASIWGLVASYLKRIWAWALFTLLILLIGLSRIVLGVHFPVDVVVGWLFGFLLLWIFLLLEAPVLAWLLRQPLAVRLLVAFAASLAFVIAGVLIRNSLAGFEIPTGWLENAAGEIPREPPIAPFDLSGLLTTTGALFGLAAGALWLYERAGFSAAGTVRQRLLRYPIGLVRVLIFWYGLGLVFPRGDDWLAYTLRYIRYALIGVWTTALAPLLFMRLGLAKRPENESP